ncbi:PhoH family protein [Gammaproteobacteria bacterium]|nr:PhoH family protein [Gammaproteobacteria bacterium]MDB4003811.1 PhoH family protein [Gammaproteobacteria bacterium]
MTADTSISNHIALEPDSAARLANLCGRLDEHLRQIENHLGVKITHRGNSFKITGDEAAVNAASSTLEHLYKETATGETLNPNAIHLALGETAQALDENVEGTDTASSLFIRTPKSSVKPRSSHQRDYVESIRRHDINFGIGPAGTGKTYLAVACAVEALVSERVNRLLLVRPAVEAGEKLGFLPGDLAQKIDPYLRPLYDALYEMLGFERVGRLIEKSVIEVAPLAYMRGRTLNNSFIILDESQNTTTAQMKMFLTRIGFGSTAVITGDATQIDLPKGERSGLIQAAQILEGIEGISFSHFNSKDVVRHRLVQKIVEAYDEHDRKNVTSLTHQDSRGESKRTSEKDEARHD